MMDLRIGDVLRDVNDEKRGHVRDMRVEAFVKRDHRGNPADAIQVRTRKGAGRMSTIRRDQLHRYRLVERDGKAIS